MKHERCNGVHTLTPYYEFEHTMFDEVLCNAHKGVRHNPMDVCICAPSWCKAKSFDHGTVGCRIDIPMVRNVHCTTASFPHECLTLREVNGSEVDVGCQPMLTCSLQAAACAYVLDAL